LQISHPNATYKVGTLIRKGYIVKVNSTSDRREYHLQTTDRFQRYCAINTNYLEIVMQRIRNRFSSEEIAQFEQMFRIISQELMPESDSGLHIDRQATI
jgi:DNA-binding MarR family transcriptional regulator